MNTEILKESIKNDVLTLFKKNQKNSNNINYFFSNSISINLYKCNVSYRDAKHITLQFDKIINSSLFNMLSNFHEILSELLIKKFGINENKKFYPIIYETENSSKFSIQCYLPQNYNKYFIECTFDNNECSFKLPHKNSELNFVNVEIRNIWESNNKLGYNIEIKKIDY